MHAIKEVLMGRTGVCRGCQAILYLILLLSPFTAHSQDLFESATAKDEDQGLVGYQAIGYLRSGVFAGAQEIREAYAEGALKLDVAGNQYGDAFFEVRYRESREGDEDAFNLREGYVNLYLGKWDFRVGRQVAVWGRADGFNPTNNLTPTDFTVFSPEEDDKRLSNFVAKGVFNAYPFKIEFDWVPVYEPSALPFEKATLPEGIEWEGYVDPSGEWGDGSFGIKTDMELPGFDGSLSYYNGYHKLPGIIYVASGDETDIYALPYKVQVLGADFSTAQGRYGIRGEFAVSIPDKDPDRLFSIPCRQMEYTLGIDREWNNFSVILQYIGKHVHDFDPGKGALGALEQEIVTWNRMIFSQQETITHSISARPSLNLFYETLKCEVLGLVNLTTEEVYLQPKASYYISDDLVLTLGAQLYYGPEDTLYGFMEEKRNSCFTELKLLF